MGELLTARDELDMIVGLAGNREKVQARPKLVKYLSGETLSGE